MSAPELLAAIFLFLIFGVPILLTFAFIGGLPIWLYGTKSGKEARSESKRMDEAKKQYEKQVAATAKVELTPSGWKNVTTRTFTIVQNAKSGRKAAIVHIGYHGRHYYLQPLLKNNSIGRSRPYWSKIANWQKAGEIDLPFIEGPASPPDLHDN